VPWETPFTSYNWAWPLQQPIIGSKGLASAAAIRPKLTAIQASALKE
jgi:hypothetical protein